MKLTVVVESRGSRARSNLVSFLISSIIFILLWLSFSLGETIVWMVSLIELSPSSLNMKLSSSPSASYQSMSRSLSLVFFLKLFSLPVASRWSILLYYLGLKRSFGGFLSGDGFILSLASFSLFLFSDWSMITMSGISYYCFSIFIRGLLVFAI